MEKSRENIDFVKQAIKDKALRRPGMSEAVIQMRFEKFTKEDVEFFKEHYFTTLKGTQDNRWLRESMFPAFVLQCLEYNMKDFFLQAFESEKEIITRLTAIRGYAAYASEEEVRELMILFVKRLRRRFSMNTMEELLSKFGLPYLVDRYGYKCFKVILQILQEEYGQSPNDLKKFYTLDENGVMINQISHEEACRRLDIWSKNQTTAT